MPPQRTIRLELAYDGTSFAGWARQPGERTVEGVLRAALAPWLEGPIVVGGRTDRGVHATGQVASFRTRAVVDLDVVTATIEAAAPDEVVVLRCTVVPRWFHAQFSAVARSYVYRWPHPVPAPASRVHRLLAELVGRRDFTAYGRATPASKSTVKWLQHASARATAEGLRVEFRADAFLRRQVRVMVATALREGAHGAPDDALVRLAQSRDRTATAPPAPAEHLTLSRIHYDPRVV
jgi:tRNA pseudouridine38-40 synthase